MVIAMVLEGDLLAAATLIARSNHDHSADTLDPHTVDDSNRLRNPVTFSTPYKPHHHLSHLSHHHSHLCYHHNQQHPGESKETLLTPH
jgi:hypothetical protein